MSFTTREWAQHRIVWLESTERSASIRAMYNAEWDDRPAEYATIRDCWLTRRRISYAADFFREACPGDRVLDVGSGVGELVIELAASRPDLRFTGVEPQPSYVEFGTASAAKRGVPNVTFRIGLADQLAPVLGPDARFEWILSNDLLHHVPDQDDVLRSVAEVASPGARWLAIEPNWRNPYVLIACAVKRGERNFWPGDFIAGANAIGWTTQNRSFLFLIPPFVKRPHRLLIDLEKAFEHYPLLAGGVALTLARSGPDRRSGRAIVRG
jgi:2-polyprenyl-3-methyl-5-hydroxy-6-metoxy-1,4-benzoquinol methylase